MDLGSTNLGSSIQPMNTMQTALAQQQPGQGPLPDELIQSVENQKMAYRKTLEDYYSRTLEQIHRNYLQSNQSNLKARQSVEKLKGMTRRAWKEYMDNIQTQVGRIGDQTMQPRIEQFPLDWLEKQKLQYGSFVSGHDEKPVKVNPKQYRRIMIRREERRRLKIKDPDEPQQKPNPSPSLQQQPTPSLMAQPQLSQDLGLSSLQPTQTQSTPDPMLQTQHLLSTSSEVKVDSTDFLGGLNNQWNQNQDQFDPFINSNNEGYF